MIAYHFIVNLLFEERSSNSKQIAVEHDAFGLLMETER